MKTFELGCWMIGFSQDWSEWFKGGCNWYEFTLIVARYEDEIHLGGREVELGLLGLHLRISWVYDSEAEGRKIIRKGIAEIQEQQPESEASTRSLDDVLKELKNGDENGKGKNQ